MRTGTIILAFICFCVGGYLSYKVFNPSTEGMVLVKQSYLDSLASFKPDTITHIDTVPSPPELVTVIKKVPYPVYVKDSSLIAYHDSLVNSELSVHVYDTISKKGIITNRKWEYKLFIPRLITKEVTIIRPIPMPYPVNVVREIRYYGGLGFGTGFSVEGGIVLKDRFIIGMQLSKDFSLFKANIIF